MDFDDFWSNMAVLHLVRISMKFMENLYSHIVYLYASQNPVLRDLGVLDPAARVNLTYELIVRLAAHFAPDVDAEQLKDEYEGFQLLNDGVMVKRGRSTTFGLTPSR